MNLETLLQILFLIVIANGSPILAKRLFKDRADFPLDFHLILSDGQPLLGKSKTFRGILSSLLLTSVIAPLIGLPWNIGMAIAIFAMLGDAISSFIKRRLLLPLSQSALGLDQIPESLLPLLFCLFTLKISMLDVVVGTAAFFVIGLVLSYFLYQLGIRGNPR
ncbi:MAG: CDP-archaeol synthase [Desulfobulbia bacterium]